MSGFVVVLRKDERSPDAELQEAMLRSLRIFGSDRHGSADSGRFSLMWAHDTGYTPHDAFERQPVRAGDRWMAVCVGYLMHREELAQALDLPQPQAERLPDSALVMKAWERWGEGCLDHISGPVSFVVCDTESNRLFVARAMERGPAVYVHEDSNRILLATTTKPIFCDPSVVREVDELRIADALVLNHEDRRRSFFKGVGIVPSGHVARATPAGIAMAQHYFLDRVKDVRFAKDEDYVEAARELLAKAVASSMRACETPALSLSSGLDSTTLAVTMLEQVRSQQVSHALPVKAFTAVPASFWDGAVRPRHAGDERAPVEALAHRYPGLEVEYVPSEHAPFDHGLDLLQSYADVPLRGVGNMPWGTEIALRCRQAGKRVMLTGASGNGTLSMAAEGVIFGTWLRQGRWAHLAREHHAAMRLNPVGNYVKILAGRMFLTALPDWLYDRVRHRRHGQGGGGFRSFSAIHPDYARDLGMNERLAELDWDDRYRTPKTRRQLMEIMVRRGARDESGALSEAMKAMAGVQGRDPLGDRRLLEFCYAIPDEQFFQGGQDRSLIKRVMAGKLPHEVLQAPRGEQSADWHGRMTRDLPRIAEEIERLADDPAMARRLDLERLRQAVRDWPERTPMAGSGHPEAAFLRYAISRAVAVARFVHQVEGRN